MATTKITGTGIGLPTADGVALGGASNEFSDLYLADGSVIYFGADQEIKVTHVADTGLTLKHTATADDKPIVLTLQTGETDMAADDIIGKIDFQAPDEGTGTDAILVAATVSAVSEGNFSSSSNATSLKLLTGNSAAAGSDGGSLILGSTGNLTLKDLRTADGSSPTLTLQSGDTDMAADDILGKIAFQAPDEGAGTDAILVAAAIQAKSEGDFSSSSNATSLDFMVGSSEAAATKMTLNSSGNLSVGDGTASLPSYSNVGDLNTGVYFPAADTVGVTAGGTEKWRFGSNPLPGRNLVINGAMNVSQRGTSDTGLGGSSGYFANDRFRYGTEGVGTGRFTLTQTADGPVGFANCLKVDCTTADGTLAAGVNQSIETRLEAQHLQHLAYGNAAAKTLTLSFYVKCTSTGTLSVLLRQQDGGRSWHQNYTIDATDTWEQKTLVFTGDASGSMADDTGIGFSIYWSLAAGSTFKGGTSGSWASHANNMYGTGDDLNVLGNTATNWFITGVQLEVGSVATDFEHENFGTTLAKAQRYYFIGGPGASGGYSSTTEALMGFQFPQIMRAAPTVSLLDDSVYTIDTAGSGNVSSSGSISYSNIKKEGAVIEIDGYSSVTQHRPFIVYNQDPFAAFTAEL